MINEILLEGESNATTAKDLCAILGMKHRELTQQIERERREGQPICASCNSNRPGYYLAQDKEQMQEYCGRLLHRMREIAATMRACKAAGERLPDTETRLAEAAAEAGAEEPTAAQIALARAQLMGFEGGAGFEL